MNAIEKKRSHFLGIKKTQEKKHTLKSWSNQKLTANALRTNKTNVRQRRERRDRERERIKNNITIIHDA